MISKLFDISGKKAIVTGASSGIGLGLLRGLHEAGAKIAAFYNSTNLSETVNDMQDKDARIYAVKCNLLNRVDIDRAFEESLSWLGGVDILINCAGMQKRCDAESFPIEDWDKIIEVNLSSVFILTQLAGREMMKKGYGKIINIASLNSFFAREKIIAYVASKGGLAQLTKAFANEWAQKGINVNAIAPGWINTKMIEPLIQNDEENIKIMERIPQKRWGTAEDLIGAAIFLASKASDYVSGIVMPVDGGYSSK